MHISDWSSDVCSSYLNRDEHLMSIDYRRRDEAAEFDIINDIDRNVRLLRGGGDGCVEHHIVSGRHHQSLASEQRSREFDRQMLRHTAVDGSLHFVVEFTCDDLHGCGRAEQPTQLARRHQTRSAAGGEKGWKS